MKYVLLTIAGLCVTAIASLAADVAQQAAEPRAIPVTRPEMKQMLEEMKGRKPRIPLPEPTDEETASAGPRGTGGYEGRLRSLYLPRDNSRRPDGGRTGGGGTSGTFGFSREPDPKSTLDYKFKTQLFWIVSRTNNCQYCMGHQESKLLGVGMTEDEIAALDFEWVRFPAKEQAAFAYARKLTYSPHKIGDEDFAALRKYFTDMQILEMTMSVSGNNAINRWKEGVGVPQSSGGGNFGRRGSDGTVAANSAARRPGEESHSYLTPTSDRFKSRVSQVAPVLTDERTGTPTNRTVFRREALESREAAEKQLAAAQTRKARLPLVSDAEAREVAGEELPEGTIPAWVRLLANFPRDGRSRIASQLSAEAQGSLSPLLKAQVAWVVARQDRAWYAAGLAKKRLGDLGRDDAAIFDLDGDRKSLSPADQAMLTVATHLAATPVVLTDNEVAEAVRLTSPRDVTQLINYVTVCASFDRITEAAALPLD